MKKCKHQTGRFVEVILATHTREVEQGKLNPDSFNNEYDGGHHHEYHCSLCGKWWKWIYKPRTKWLNELFVAAYSENLNK